MAMALAKMMQAETKYEDDDAGDDDCDTMMMTVMTVQWVNLPPEMTAERGSSPPLMQLQTSWLIRIHIIEIIMVDTIFLALLTMILC